MPTKVNTKFRGILKNNKIADISHDAAKTVMNNEAMLFKDIACFKEDSFCFNVVLASRVMDEIKKAGINVHTIRYVGKKSKVG